jgi:hypothetical protein
MVTAPPPVFGEEFLEWLRATTEDHWRQVDEMSVAEFAATGWIGADWRRGTRWTGGLSDSAIDDVQQRFAVEFPPEHRLFLRMLHCTTPWQRRADSTGGEFRRPGFYDWINEEPEIRVAMRNVVEGLAPGTIDSAAPALIPIFGHRHVVATAASPVLSMVGDDIIIYGRNLRDYLLHELHNVLGLERDPAWTDREAGSIPFCEFL